MIHLVYNEIGATTEKLVDKLYITRIGKIRILYFNGATANSSTGVYYTGLPAADRPNILDAYNAYNMCLYQNTTGVNVPGYVQVASNGAIVGRYYTVQGSVAISPWPTYATLVYTV